MLMYTPRPGSKRARCFLIGVALIISWGREEKYKGKKRIGGSRRKGVGVIQAFVLKKTNLERERERGEERERGVGMGGARWGRDESERERGRERKRERGRDTKIG